MSLFGAMSTAISGINAQSGAFSNISDNVANSETVGFKRVDTSFLDYLTNSTAEVNDSGSVSARPDYVNDVQGTVTQTQNALNLAITGQGFFAVSQQNGTASGLPTFSAQQFYTRTGDFSLDKNGYLANSAGNVLDGWAVDQTGAVQRSTLAPIQVAKSIFSPVATTQVTVAANLPATPASTSTTSSQVAIYDALGNKHAVTLNWTQNATNDWTVAVDVPDDTTAAARGTADVKFGSASGNAVPDGTIGSIGGATGSVTGSAYAAGSASSISFTTNLGSGPQTVQINLGTYGQATGITQFAGTDYNLRSLTQNGVAPDSSTPPCR
jgi:flagellar hook protein FlgE